jgi:hypothetical protein
MGIDNKDELDDELVKSLERLVEEETSVAKAFVDNQKESSAENTAAKDSQDTDIEMGKTKVIPKVTTDMLTKSDDDVQKTGVYNVDEVRDNIRNIPVKNSDSGVNLDVDLDVNSDVSSDIDSDKHADSDKHVAGGTASDDKKKKIIIGVSCGIAALLVLIGIITGVVIHNRSKESYKYNYEKGMESYKNNDYDSAVKYLSKAAKLNEGKKNTDLKYTLYECYKEENNTDKQIETLKDILSYDENNQKSIQELASIYEQKKDGNALNTLIKSYKNKEGYKYLSDYVVENPKPSVEAGTYDDEVKLQFTESSSSTIYYTQDKSEPTEKSTKYNGDTIEIKNGTTTIKAVAVNSIGVYSDVVELQYVVDYKKPSTPTVSPESGTYAEGQQVTISNIPVGSKAYYTLDGSTPTAGSEEYTEPFDIPEGNNVISVIIIDSHNQASSVVKRNYVINKAKTFSYNECLEILKNRLIADSVLKSDGNTTSDGRKVTFVYQPKATVNSVEMYIVRFDVTDKSKTSTEGYYGIGIKNGTCYKVTNSNGSYSSSEY